MRLKFIMLFTFLALGSPVISQSSFFEIPEDLASYYNQRKAEAIEYAIANNLPIRQEFTDGTIVEIQYLDESGKPLYFKTLNAEAAFTTSTNKLYMGSDLGLNLSGKGIKVGIWDGGLVRATHIEFENRAQIVEGSSVSGHATHVTGTILAKGINPAAKGMAYEATSVNYDGLNGDGSEMKNEAQDGLLLSNHSYGTVLGWSYNSSNGSWQWVGDISVSSQEDYRFGYYSSASAIWDDIAFDNPNYLIVKSAGNDRTDIGNGNGPPPDGPYDIVGPQGVAKNILTIGSVNSLSAPYTSPSDVTLADYSSWGPTDDGRVKPDIVGMGQNVLSTSSDGDDLYNVLSGTSMASPNVTGSLALLQQQYHQQHHTYLSAAELKALVIHTAYETGVADGPDYQYGWGLLNTEAASKMLMLDGKPGYMVKLDSLLQGATSTIPVTMDVNQKLTVTIVWTDPAGEAETVPAVDPPAIKLVNDLDIRITDENGLTYFPWAMNPDTKQAFKGDNFRDNIEKIELLAPSAGIYTISVTHKGSLLNNKQDFAITISSSDMNEKLRPFYFVGSSINFLDQANWSDVSGGTSVNQVPGPNDIIIFDDNSQGSLTQSKITLPNNFSCFSLAASGNSAFEFDLNGNTLSVESKVSVSNNSFVINNGLIDFVGQDISISMQLLPQSLSVINIQITGNGKALNLLSNINVDTLMINSGKFNSNSFAINASKISVSNSSIDLASSEIAGLDDFSIVDNTSVVLAENTVLIFDGKSVNKVFNGGDDNFGVIRLLNDQLSIAKLNSADSLIIASKLILLTSANIEVVELKGLSSLLIGDGQELIVGEEIVLNSSTGNRTTISNFDTGTGLSSGIRSETNPKLCFDFVDVSNVNVSGNTKFVLGTNSTLSNAIGWIQANCQDVLASGFTYDFTCTGGITYFTDISDGNPDSWVWDFGDGSQNSTDQNPQHSFLDIGVYSVRLSVESGTETSTYSTLVNIDAPNLAIPNIVLENNQLRSTSFADNYQWFFDLQPILGETDYFLNDFSKSGSYHIEIWDNDCRLASEAFIVTSLDENLYQLKTYPNPFNNQLIIRSGYNGKLNVIIRSVTGKLMIKKEFDVREGDFIINTSMFPQGIYFIDIEQNNYRKLSRIIKVR